MVVTFPVLELVILRINPIKFVHANTAVGFKTHLYTSVTASGVYVLISIFWAEYLYSGRNIHPNFDIFIFLGFTTKSRRRQRLLLSVSFFPSKHLDIHIPLQNVTDNHIFLKKCVYSHSNIPRPTPILGTKFQDFNTS